MRTLLSLGDSYLLARQRKTDYIRETLSNCSLYARWFNLSRAVRRGVRFGSVTLSATCQDWKMLQCRQHNMCQIKIHHQKPQHRSFLVIILCFKCLNSTWWLFGWVHGWAWLWLCESGGILGRDWWWWRLGLMSALQVVDTEDTPGHCYQSVPLGGFSHSLTQSRNPLQRRKKNEWIGKC